MSSILRQQVLVLNKSWVAVNTCTVRRAIVLMSGEKAVAVDEELNSYSWEEWLKLDPGNSCIHSPSRSFKVPSVIVSTTTTRPRISQNFTKLGLFRRDKYTCQYCSNILTHNRLSIDHVLPRSRGGKHNWLNCVTACKPCNNYKADQTPEEAGMTLIELPYKPTKILCDEPIPELWRKFLPK